MSRNTYQVAPVVFGCMYLGCPIGAIDDLYKKSDTLNMLTLTRPAFMFCHISLYDLVKECLDELGNSAKIFTFDGQVGDSVSVDELMMANGDETNFL